MKKRFAMVVVSLMIMVGIFAALGFTGAKDQNYVIDTKINKHLPKPMQEGPMVEKAKEKLGFSSSEENTRLHMVLKTEQPNPEELIFTAQGDGFLNFGQDKFSFKVNEEKSYLQQVNNEGEPVLVGLIVGEIKSKKNTTEEVMINTIYEPNTQRGQFGVVVGTLEDLIMIPYGDPFVDENLAKLINKEVYNQQ